MKNIVTATETQATAHHAQHHVGRLAVTLNVGLVGNPYSGLSQGQRAKAYADDIAEILSASGTQHSPVADTVLLLQSFFPATDESVKAGGIAPIAGLAVAWSERVTENTDVLSFDIIRDNGATTTATAEQVVSALVHRLASLLGQEAIAVTWADEGARDIGNRIQGEGVYGPKAQAWGDFTPAYFQRFLNAALNEPARFPAPAAQIDAEAVPVTAEGIQAA